MRNDTGYPMRNSRGSNVMCTLLAKSVDSSRMVQLCNGGTSIFVYLVGEHPESRNKVVIGHAYRPFSVRSAGVDIHGFNYDRAYAVFCAFCIMVYMHLSHFAVALTEIGAHWSHYQTVSELQRPHFYWSEKNVFHVTAPYSAAILPSVSALCACPTGLVQRLTVVKIMPLTMKPQKPPVNPRKLMPPK